MTDAELIALARLLNDAIDIARQAIEAIPDGDIGAEMEQIDGARSVPDAIARRMMALLPTTPDGEAARRAAVDWISQ